MTRIIVDFSGYDFDLDLEYISEELCHSYSEDGMPADSKIDAFINEFISETVDERRPTYRHNANFAKLREEIRARIQRMRDEK